MFWKEKFPALSHQTYLNTAGAGLLSTETSNWRHHHDEEYLSTGSNFRLNAAELIHDTKTALANLFDADIAYTYLVPNFSFGFNTLLSGLSSDHRFLLLQEDYPSINYPVVSRGFETFHVKIDTNLEGDIVQAIINFKPTVLALSIVQYSNGIMLDPKFFNDLKIQFPSLLIIVDGTQFCGTQPFSFKNSGIDVLIASGYKWMQAGYGNGFVFMKENLKEHIFQDAQNHHPQDTLIQQRDVMSLYMEPGHQDTLAFGTLNQAAQMLSHIGLHHIQDDISAIKTVAKKAFIDRGLLTEAVVKRDHHSSIYNLLVPNNILSLLADANIVVTARGKGIRASFHYYNTIEDLECLLQVLDR